GGGGGGGGAGGARGPLERIDSHSVAPTGRPSHDPGRPVGATCSKPLGHQGLTALPWLLSSSPPTAAARRVPCAPSGRETARSGTALPDNVSRWTFGSQTTSPTG